MTLTHIFQEHRLQTAFYIDTNFAVVMEGDNVDDGHVKMLTHPVQNRTTYK